MEQQHGGNPSSRAGLRLRTASSPDQQWPDLRNPQRPQQPLLLSSFDTLKRPRKLASNPTLQTGSLAEYPPRNRSSSWGSAGGLASIARSSQIHLPAGQPFTGYRSGIKVPNEIFATLPREVFELILLWLKNLHLGQGSDSCATCWMRDLCSLSLCSRKLRNYARMALYDDIQLLGPDSAAHKKRFKNAQGSRMVLLRRTLRSNPDIARLVHTLKVPRPEPPANWSASKGFTWLDQYEDRIASLVTACPNLERLSSPTWMYGHSFKKIFHALSTRKNLKDMIWVLEPATSTTTTTTTTTTASHRPGSSSKRILAQETTGVLTPSQEDAFLDLHRDWSFLQSLSIYCRPGSLLAPHTLLSRALTCLPSLQRLRLCNLPSDAFNDRSLLSLPPLQSLTLSHIQGITSAGLSAFATRPNSLPLQRLDLRHTPLTSLAALARIFSNLPNMTSFSLIQTFQPVMPETDSFTLWMMPYLASPSIVKMHWDITSTAGPHTADDILARSIEAGGFPSLTSLRTPNDPKGQFQALCRPVHQISLPSDRFGRTGGTGGLMTSHSWSSLPASPSTPLSPIHPIHKSLTMMSLPSQSSQHLATLATDLVAARLAAQARLEAARDEAANPRIRVNVTADDGRVALSFGMATYMGTLGSRIAYHLRPDEGAADELGGLLDVSDLVGDGGETLAGNMSGCSGAWNTREGVVADKREKEKWWHTERGRWREIDLG